VEQIGALLKSFIYLISNSLLYPDLFLLCALTLWMIYYAGTFVARWLHRRQAPQDRPSGEAEGPEHPSPACSQHVAAFVEALQDVGRKGAEDADLQAEALLEEHTALRRHSLDAVRLVVRVGPGLGLIGTLIPMGTGLAGLSQGDMTRLASDLVIAFTTTVVGLALGMSAYFFYVVERRWVSEDIRAMEYEAEKWLRERQKEKENKACGSSEDDALGAAWKMTMTR
jgi:biopolymer transport protein ExbB/TolQ